jgi:hypothetical protein
VPTSSEANQVLKELHVVGNHAIAAVWEDNLLDVQSVYIMYLVISHSAIPVDYPRLDRSVVEHLQGAWVQSLVR